MITLIFYLAPIFCLLFGNFLLGEFLGKALKITSPKTFFTNFFLKTLIGCIISTSLFAIIFTNGKTILALFIPILILFYITLKKEKEKEQEKILFSNEENNYFSKANIINYLYLFLICLVIIPYIFIGHYPNASNPYPNYFFDAVFYSKVSEYIYLTGMENASMEANIISKDYAGVFPYHYFELWLNALISNLFGLSYLVAHETTLKSFLIIIAILSFLSCIEQIKKINVLDIILVISFAFIGGFYLKIFDKLSFIKIYGSMHVFSMASFLSLNKIILITIFFAIITLIVIKNKLHFIIFPILSLALINFLSIAGVFSSLVLLLICNEFYNFGIHKKTSRIQIVYIFVFFMLIMFYYWVFSPAINTGSKINLSDTIIANLSNFKSKINYIIGLIISHIAYYLLFVFFIILSINQIFIQIKKKKNQFFILFFLLLFLTSNIISSLLAGITDYPQIYTNNLTAFLYLLPLLLILIFYQFKQKYLFFIYVFGLIILVFNYTSYNSITKKIFSTDYLTTIQQKIQKIENPLGVSIYTDMEGYQGPATHNSLGGYLKIMKPYFNTINVGTYLALQNNTNSPKYITERLKNTPFVRYAQKKNINNFDEILLDFIKTYKIKYIIIEKIGKIPENLKNMIVEIIDDKISGEKFIILK